MKQFTLIVLLLISFNVFAQDFNSIRKPLSLNAVSVRVMEPLEEESDNRDTVYIQMPDTISHEHQYDHEKNSVDSNSLRTIAFATPLERLRKTSGYGYRVHPILKKWMFHSGVDLASSSDTVYSMLSGTVKSAGYSPTLGYYVRTQHSEGKVEVLYAHLSEYHYKAGETISAGEPIGITGSTGRSTGDHLHLGVYKDGQHVDPIPFMSQILDFNKHQTHINHEHYTRKSDLGTESDIRTRFANHPH